MEIEIPEKVTKLLVYCRDPRISGWQLGEFGIFQETHKVLETTKNPKEDAPALVGIKYEDVNDVLDFIQESQLKAARLFKTAIYKEKAPLGFFYTTAKNLLALFAEVKGQRVTFKISSPKKELRDKFYEVAKKINEEFSYNHSFDYDKYDIELILREFSEKKHKILVTYFYGKDYPNVRIGDLE